MKAKLRVILMDDSTEGYFEEGGLRAVKRADEKYGCSYDIIEKTFDTEAERQAYIDALYDMAMGCWSSYAILN